MVEAGQGKPLGLRIFRLGLDSTSHFWAAAFKVLIAGPVSGSEMAKLRKKLSCLFMSLAFGFKYFPF